MIEFIGVTKRYGRKTAVDDLSLVVPSGELFALLGPNGAGKTTSIKLIVGLLRPSAGEVRVCGLGVTTATREASRRVGYAPDEPHLYDKLTGREFLEFIAEMYVLDDARLRIDRQIEFFELDDFADELSENYSHGMKQRVALAAALLHDPAVLVVDEPMVGLDPRSARLVKDLLRQRAAAGTTIFMSTHTLGLAEEIAHRVGIVHQGRLVCVGTLDELQRKWADRGGNLEQMFLEITSSRETKSATAIRREPGATP